MTRREKAIRRRRKFIITTVLVFLCLVGIIVSVVSCSINKKSSKKDDNGVASGISSTINSSDNAETSGKTEKLSEEDVIDNKTGLDKQFSEMTLINAQNPLPQTYDSDVRQDLVEIDKELRNNDYVTKIHKSVYPYITAMVKAAQADGVDLKVWSPFRSYADQKVLFDKQVERQNGDEQKAATVVARPGTSEHNSGLCADFNMADDAFESTPMYKWMCENAEDYGFILRYPKNKQEKTGVIYESWHWRFVGINKAKAINKSGLCLEEFIEQNGKN